MSNYKLGVKYNSNCKLSVLQISNVKNPSIKKYQMIVFSIDANKSVDHFNMISNEDKEVVKKQKRTGLKLFIKSFDKDDKLIPITHEDFITKFVVNNKDNAKILKYLEEIDNVYCSPTPANVVLGYLKCLTNNQGYNTLHEKHMGIILVYGFNLTLTQARKIINEK